MQKETFMLLPFVFVAQAVLVGAPRRAPAQLEKASSPAMAPLNQYLMPDERSEIALARSAAPASISDGAEVMVLGREGYTTAVRGSNGFLCMVERSWGAATDDPDFWNPSVRAPICFNPPAARTVVPIFLMKTKLVLTGESKTTIVRAIASALDKGKLPALESGAMCYMMSKQQYLSDQGKSWHPHLMFFVPGSAAKSWGGNLPGSPVIAADDPEERVTLFLVWVATWSDGTPAPRSRADPARGRGQHPRTSVIRERKVERAAVRMHVAKLVAFKHDGRGAPGVAPDNGRDNTLNGVRPKDSRS